MSLGKLCTTTIITLSLLFSAASLAAENSVKTTTQKAVSSTTVVNINTADAKTLMGLKGMSSKKAQAIVDYRAKNGQFASIDDLAKVKGFGEKSVAKLKKQNPDLITTKSAK